MPAIPDELMDVGLEDFDQNDFVMPRITIAHKAAPPEYVDSLTGQRWKDLDCVVLGLVKQRTMWPLVMGETKDAPLCRSYNHTEGNPGEKFPWDRSSFVKPTDASEAVTLACADCNFKDWGSNPTKGGSWCTEQFVLPLMIPISEEIWAPAILSLQRSAMSNTKAYLSAFKNARQPVFVNRTTLSLEALKRGNEPYAVPLFKKGEQTDQKFWLGWADKYRSVRDYLQRPRTHEDTDPNAAANAEAQKAGAEAREQVLGDDEPF